jgi:rsbT co-antagonist protein RsbR
MDISMSLNEKNTQKLKLFDSIINMIPQKVFVKDKDYKWLYANDKLLKDLALTLDELVGKTDFDLFARELAEKYHNDDKRIVQKGENEYLEERYVVQGQESYVATTKIPIKDEKGNNAGVLGLFQDITKEKQMEEKIKQQAKEILENATPVVQLIEGIVVAPIIGTLDSSRTQQVTEKILQSIVETRSTIALLDITGVPTVDTVTASHLIETIAAVKLLGAHVILTGIRPAIAQTIVHLGVDLSNVITQSSLENGFRIALKLNGYSIIKKNTEAEQE